MSSDWPPTMALLEGAWAAICRVEAQQVDLAIEQWRMDVARMAADQDLLETSGEWQAGPFDLLSIVGLERWERAHSAALGWLLDPAAAHGLGDSMLTAFLRRAGLGDLSAEGRLEVVLEADGGTAFVDVLLRCDSWTLVIEVKLDAVEQPDQAWRLWSDWRDRTPCGFVFLTPSGRPTTTHRTEECRAAWTSVRWRDVLKDLERSLRTAKGAARGLEAAGHYAKTLKRLYGS